MSGYQVPLDFLNNLDHLRITPKNKQLWADMYEFI